MKKIFNNEIFIVFIAIFLTVIVKNVCENVVPFSNGINLKSKLFSESTSTATLDLSKTSEQITALEEQIDELKSNVMVLNETYPVGSIYISVSPKNPGTIVGGTWTAVGAGRTLVGINTSSANFNTSGKTGGSSTVTLTTANLPSHTHSIPALSGTAASAGAHTHTVSETAASAGSHTHTVWGQGYYITDNYTGITTRPALSWTQLTVDPVKTIGGAYASGAHTHTVSGTAASAGAHTHSVTTDASTTGATGSASAVSVQDPYIVVYFWRRTA